jgi:ATP-dependent Zn protease
VFLGRSQVHVLHNWLSFGCEVWLSLAVLISQVTGMARAMVINYGFSDIGPWSLLDQSAQSQDMIMRMMARNSVSESLQRKIDDAVKKIADEAYAVALQQIRCSERRWLLQRRVVITGVCWGGGEVLP